MSNIDALHKIKKSCLDLCIQSLLFLREITKASQYQFGCQ